VLADVQEDVPVLLYLKNKPVGLGDPGLKNLSANTLDLFRVQGRVKKVRLEKLELLEGPDLKGRG